MLIAISFDGSLWITYRDADGNMMTEFCNYNKETFKPSMFYDRTFAQARAYHKRYMDDILHDDGEE